METKLLHRAVFTALTGMVMFLPVVGGSFTSQKLEVLTAEVTVGPGATALDIEATPLGSEAFFGKNMMIPVTIRSKSGAPIDPSHLRVDIVYQLVDASGSPLGPPVSVPIPFVPGPAVGDTLQGTAIIYRTDLSAIQTGGNIRYEFRARQGASDTVLGSGGQVEVPPGGSVLASPFQISIIDQVCSEVGPAGARVSAPDLSDVDGRTAVVLSRGAVLSSGKLCIKAEQNSPWSVGPLGTRAAVIYSVRLEETSLVAPAELILSYPADLSGKVLGTGDDPKSLGIYWLDEKRLQGDWRPISRATLDTTLHTLTGQTGHFSIFGLFPAGAIGSADLRPAERIITPNGDGINDKAVFGSGIDEVKIFDIRGRRVRSIPGPTPEWDGTDDSGVIVESGVYIYQYTTSDDRVSGVIGVAK